MSAPYYRFRWVITYALGAAYAVYALLAPRSFRKR